jgi:hypothetical protein
LLLQLFRRWAFRVSLLKEEDLLVVALVPFGERGTRLVRIVTLGVALPSAEGNTASVVESSSLGEKGREGSLDFITDFIALLPESTIVSWLADVVGDLQHGVVDDFLCEGGEAR